MKKTVTMKDIAGECGIARATVSLILNGHGKRLAVSDELCRRVVNKAVEMGYKRNELALSIRNGKSRTVAYVVTTMRSSYEMEELSGVNRACAEAGYALRIFTPSDHPVEEIANQIISGMIAGVVGSIPPEHFGLLQSLLSHYGIPMTSPKISSVPFGVSVFTTDNRAGAGLAADRFHELGHRRIGLCYVQAEILVKHIGFLERLKELGVETPQELRLGLSFDLDWNDSDAGKVSDYMKKIKPTAVFCESDPLCMRFLSYAQEAGFRIPEDVSVIGYAGLEYTRFSTPPLSTVKTPFDKIGYGATRLLLEEIGGKAKPGRLVYTPCSYIERKSTRKLNLNNK